MKPRCARNLNLEMYDVTVMSRSFAAVSQLLPAAVIDEDHIQQVKMACVLRITLVVEFGLPLSTQVGRYFKILC